jgi:hypothetical protein
MYRSTSAQSRQISKVRLSSGSDVRGRVSTISIPLSRSLRRQPSHIWKVIVLFDISIGATMTNNSIMSHW